MTFEGLDNDSDSPTDPTWVSVAVESENDGVLIEDYRDFDA